MEEQINLGDKVKDKMTGAEGAVIAIATYILENPQVQVQPFKTTEDGQPAPAFWLPKARVSLVTRNA